MADQRFVGGDLALLNLSVSRVQLGVRSHPHGKGCPYQCIAAAWGLHDILRITTAGNQNRFVSLSGVASVVSSTKWASSRIVFSRSRINWIWYFYGQFWSTFGLILNSSLCGAETFQTTRMALRSAEDKQVKQNM